MLNGPVSERSWWRNAVIYEVYPRSFADANGDGEGDLRGLIEKLDYLAELGVDALWLTPFYPSPMADGGYDVADYCDVDPRFGSLADVEELIAAAGEHGIRIMIDLVANHCSELHPWFQAALAAAPGSPERDRFIFRDGKGEEGELPPNNWISNFGGIGWKRIVEADGKLGQWYFHTFAPEQPDFNWDNPEVAAEFQRILRFWFDRGVAGIRADAVPAMAKVAGLPDADYGGDLLFRSNEWVGNPHWDVDGVHDILRGWRKVADEYPDERVFVTEAVVSSPARLARYVRPDEMQTSFNFDFQMANWDAKQLRQVIDDSLAALAPANAPCTWVLSSHDVPRHLTRFGREVQATVVMGVDPSGPSDYALGDRRARAAALLMLGLPGSAYLYQGEELGLPNVDDLPDNVLQDPIYSRSGGRNRGRDGCRVPLPWGGTEPPFEFSPRSGQPWLPQPASWVDFTRERQEGDPASMLQLYRAALRLRRELAGLQTERMRWQDSLPNVLIFDRGADVRVIVNLSGLPIDVSGHGEVVLASLPVVRGLLPSDAAAWLRV